ncbi:MAG: indole-3-glycerol phosphate synthase TrpC [Parvularculaceae bacterium]|nr:indole-3-glycerol phosphate synthase TrpC [Parvularculaceae bacterium]
MTILDRIIAYKAEEVRRAKATTPVSALEARIAALDPTRGFRRALEARRERVALIAEIKKASPSKGLIRAAFEPAALARAYRDGGADCLSVLTDAPSFQGAPEHLLAARAAVDLPILRKDFVIDAYQATEARAWGADCILLIMACLDDARARDLAAAAASYGLDVLWETHDEAEFDRALALGADLVGVNNRDLRTFVTDLSVTERLARRATPSVLLVSESGVTTKGDAVRLRVAGARAILVGESLMRADDVAAATRELLRTP